jgi:hypothetical protein
MFKISGIPHYALVGKDGKVINPALGYFDNARLKALLIKYFNDLDYSLFHSFRFEHSPKLMNHS